MGTAGIGNHIGLHGTAHVIGLDDETLYLGVAGVPLLVGGVLEDDLFQGNLGGEGEYELDWLVAAGSRCSTLGRFAWR